MDNPYQTPAEVAPGPTFEHTLPPRSPSRAVRHVRIVAALMIVQGVLELPLALCFGGVAAIFPMIAQSADPRVLGPEGENIRFFWLVTITYGVLAVLHLAASILHIVAGWRNYHFKGRVLGMVAMWVGIITLLLPLCTITALGLLVYGMIIYLNPAVERAFQMGERGYSVDDIKAVFYEK